MSPPHSTHSHSKHHRRNKFKFKNAIHLLRRLLILAVAIVYIDASVKSTIKSIHVLRGAKNPPIPFEAYETTNLIKYMGNGPVTVSPLLLEVMQNDTTPRNYTLFFEANNTISRKGCAAPLFNGVIYNNLFLRLGVSSLIRDASFNFPELLAFEIVQTIVDCSFTPIATGNPTLVRQYYLMRHRVIPNYVIIFATRFSMQNYRITDRSEEGPVGLVTFVMIKDMRETSVTTKFAGAVGYPFEYARFYPYENAGLNDQGWWILNSVSPNPLTTPTHSAITSSRTGFFVKSDSEQSNIKNLHWTIDTDPMQAITKWNWRGEPVLKDSWAWVHFVHAYFALDGLFNLGVLFVVSFRNLQKGKIWVGDAFVSISSTLLLRGGAIFVSWVVNGYWSLLEWCLHDAHALAGTQEIFFFPEIIHADLLTIHLALSTILGYLFKERIDPIIAVGAFEIGFYWRLSLAKAWFPSVRAFLQEYAKQDHAQAIVSVSETVSAYAPMRMWTTHALYGINVRVVLASLLPVFSSSVLVLVYVVLRKVYDKIHPDKVRVIKESNVTAQSENESALLQYKRNLTIFELSTGVELQARFGVISDFENYLIIKGMKYASADGIYSNGFVIVNGKVLVATADLPALVAMKLLRLRVRNIYSYAIDGNTVQRTAQLIYPDALTWEDLTHLNLNVLS